MDTLGDDFPKQQARLRKLLLQYKEIGPAGMFGAAMIEQTLRKADAVAISGDPVGMIQVYKEMKEYKS